MHDHENAIAAAPEASLPVVLLFSVPVVYIEPPSRLIRQGIPYVMADHVEVARFAFRELLSGHPLALAFIGGRWNRGWSRDRGRSFAALARGAGLPFFPFPYRREGDAARHARLRAFVRSLPHRCGVFCATDLTATDVSRFAREERRGVPRDLAFVGVNDAGPESLPTKSSVTSVRLDFERMGYEAAKLRGDRIGVSAGRSAAPPSSAVGPLLVKRRLSTRGGGRRSPEIAKAVEMIRAEACDGLTAAALAARFPGTRRLFDLRFREAMGHPVHDEILDVRLEKACNLLARTRTAIGAIPALCGFGSEIALQKLFVRRYGVSMRKWRTLHGCTPDN